MSQPFVTLAIASELIIPIIGSGSSELIGKAIEKMFKDRKRKIPETYEIFVEEISDTVELIK